MIDTYVPPVIATTAPTALASSTAGEIKSFQKSLNACALNLFRQMDQVRSDGHKNFFFFTPNLMASYSMLYAGAPAELKPHMEAAFQMGEVKGEKWHKNFQAWSEGIQNRTQSFT